MTQALREEKNKLRRSVEEDSRPRKQQFQKLKAKFSLLFKEQQEGPLWLQQCDRVIGDELREVKDNRPNMIFQGFGL